MSSASDSSARLAAIVASSDDAIISTDLRDYITSWNAAAERMFGYSEAEAVGRHISVLIPEDRTAEEADVLAHLEAGAPIEHYQTVRLRKDGSPIEVSLAISPIRDASGAIVGVSKIGRDMTITRRAERESRHLAAIVSSSADAIISKDLDGIIQSWNRGAEMMFGYTAEEAVGRSILLLIPDDRHDEETNVLTRIRAGLTVDHFETIRKRKDGSPIDISLTVSPVKTADGRIIGASKIARDISEQRRLREAAEDASRMKDEFLALLSHELRTPLNTVLGYSRMLRRDGERMTDELRERALAALERNAEALTRLVNDVLDTSRVVTGKLRLSLDSCAIDQVVAEAVETVAQTAEAKGVELEAAVGHGLVVMGDRNRLLQVLWNLLANAIKFTSSGGRVTVRARRGHGSVLIEVEDSGVGIDKADLPYVFQRFWQAQTGVSREYGGLGLGLALSRHLVELHGGHIAAASGGTGLGATFTITLPSAGTVLARERHLHPVAK